MATVAPSPEARVRRGGSGRLVAAELAAAAGVAALVTAALLPVGDIEDGPVLCPFRRLTGLPCPGCGMTRSWVYLMHGNWQDAIAANAFGPVAVLAALLLAAAVVRARWTRSRPPDLDELVRRLPARIVVALWLGYAALRLAYAL